MGELNARQQKAIEALAAGSTIEKAAIYAGVTERTVFKWKAENSAFQQALKKLESEALESAARVLSFAATDAVRILQGIAGDAEAKPSVRVAAARVILDCVLRYREMVTLEQRLEQIEHLLGERAL